MLHTAFLFILLQRVKVSWAHQHKVYLNGKVHENALVSRCSVCIMYNSKTNRSNGRKLKIQKTQSKRVVSFSRIHRWLYNPSGCILSMFFSLFVFSYSKEKRIKNWIENVGLDVNVGESIHHTFCMTKKGKKIQNVLLSHLSSVCLLTNICIKNITSRSFFSTSQKMEYNQDNAQSLSFVYTIIFLCLSTVPARELPRANTKNFGMVHVKRMLFHSHSLNFNWYTNSNYSCHFKFSSFWI